MSFDLEFVVASGQKKLHALNKNSDSLADALPSSSLVQHHTRRPPLDGHHGQEEERNNATILPGDAVNYDDDDYFISGDSTPSRRFSCW